MTFPKTATTPEILAGFSKEWPRRTGVSCWWCCHTFDTLPIPTVVGYDERKDRFTLQGVFCSWNCSRAYASKTPQWSTTIPLLCFLRKRCEGSCKPITNAPSRYLLKMFGGTMSIEEFRAAFETGTEITVLPTPLCMARTEVSVRDAPRVVRAAPTESLSASLSNAIQTNTTKNDTLRLKRSGPKQAATKTAANLLQKMNIVVK